MSKSLGEGEIRNLKKGQRLRVIFSNGDREFSHPAKFLGAFNDQAHLLVYFTDAPQQKVRWSLRTNKPVGEAAYVGRARLELAVR